MKSWVLAFFLIAVGGLAWMFHTTSTTSNSSNEKILDLSDLNSDEQLAMIEAVFNHCEKDFHAGLCIRLYSVCGEPCLPSLSLKTRARMLEAYDLHLAQQGHPPL